MTRKIKKINYSKIRTPNFSDEFNDCSVIALSIAMNISYANAHKIMALFGRRPRNKDEDRRGKFGPKFYKGLQKLSGGGICAWHGSVKKFLETRQQGRYLIWVANHVFAVVDGVIHDSYPLPFVLRRRILGAWHFV